MKEWHLPYFLFPFTACWLCGLQFGRPTQLRSHVKSTHDSVGSPFQEALASVWAQQVTGFLYALARVLGLVSLDAMVSYAYAARLLPREPMPDERRAMGLYASAFASPSAGLPPGRTSELLSCHALGGLCARLSGPVKARLPGLLSVPCGFLGLPSIETPFAVDSHFHLDKLLSVSGTSSFQDALAATPGIAPYSLRFAIANYCFPEYWSKFQGSGFGAEDTRVFRSIGFHPSRVDSHAHLEDLHGSMRRMLSDPRAVAVGEIGLDYHPRSSARTRSRQRSLFRTLLELALELEKPVVIHCRGYGQDEAEEDCIQLLGEILPRYWKIHRHCFTGTPEQLVRWRCTFPNTVFGFTCLLTSQQYAVLSPHLSLNHTVLESDAPYLVPAGAGSHFSSPFLLSRVAGVIASELGCSITEVLSTTGATATRFYGLEPSYIF